MTSWITLLRPFPGDVVKVPMLETSDSQNISESYIRQRFGLSDGVHGLQLALDYDSSFLPFCLVDGERRWRVRPGQSYVVIVPNVTLPSPAKMEVVDVSSSSDDDSGLVKKNIFASSGRKSPSPPPAPNQVYRVSALDRFLGITGTSELSAFVKRRTWEVQQVSCLPERYNGDIVFEFPPLRAYQGRGHFLQGMDRDMDCYSWTRIVATSARIHPPKQYTVSKVNCTGYLECQNMHCQYFRDRSVRNSTSWLGRPKVSRVHKVGELVPEGGVVCGFCQKPPFCVRSCSARLFFMYPRPDVDPDMLPHMSRLAVHMGNHDHLPRRILSRECFKKVENLVKTEVVANPSATPAKIKNLASGKLVNFLHPDTAENLSEEEEKEIWDSLQVISTPAKFAQVLRSVKIGRPEASELDCIIRMQKNIRFPYIQRYLYPGQGNAEDRCHIFKMSVKGPGSGVDLLRRMQKGGSLYGAWVLFDVMHRCTKGWVTFSAHVYDHNYRALCTLFTCELKAQDALSLEKAWRLMVEIAGEYGLEDVSIHGFMADNAEAGWIAVRNVFFGGFPNPQRERSDAFHFRQSFNRHSQEGIKPERREEHLKLWEKLRNASSYVAAYRIADEISVWWRAGNCIVGKEKMLQGWMAWWVVRWRQWGSYIRLGMDPLESARMPNTTGAESVHASMRASQPRKKVTVVEACETDQNRAASQIAAFIAYKNGQSRGRGPTIFELAFRNSEAVGSPKAHEDALNLLLSSTGKYDLLRTSPLHGDIQTGSYKRKVSSAGFISPQDSHRHDQVLRTTPNPSGFKRRNLDFSGDDFTAQRSTPSPHPVVLSVSSSDDDPSSDDIQVLSTPMRPSTRSQPSPANVAIPPTNESRQDIVVTEMNVAHGSWHFRRTGRGGSGPVCNASMKPSNSAREECKNRIKKVSFQNRAGVVGIAVMGERLVGGVPMRAMLWFCPNNDCHRQPPRRAVLPLPVAPLVLPVMLGTNISRDELDFLLKKGFKISGIALTPPSVPRVPRSSPSTQTSTPARVPGPLDLRIDLNTFPEDIIFENPHERLKSRNGKRTRQRLGETAEQDKRVRAALDEEMRVVDQLVILEGKGYGKQILIATHENDGRFPKQYWLQMCCFPTCSCDDFYKRHTRGKPYLSCKHLLWVYKNVFRYDLHSHICVRQPILTVGEVREMLLRQIEI